MRMFASVLVVVFTFLTVVPRVDAQTSHTAPQAALDAALQQHVASSAADRETVMRLLDRPEVQSLAGEMGLDLQRAKSAVSTLDGRQLTDLAAQAQQAEEGLAGGQSRIVISTTLIIIVLLVIILLVVAID